jgi:chemotaxis protein MotC
MRAVLPIAARCDREAGRGGGPRPGRRFVGLAVAGLGLGAVGLGAVLLIPALAVASGHSAKPEGAPAAKAEGAAAAKPESAPLPRRPSNSTEPYELIRSLELMQNEAADGNTTAYAARPKLVAQIAEKLLAVDPQLWRDERNARALAIYVMSGGQPGVLRRIIALDVLPKADENLMKGILAYADGHETEAKALLKDINAQSLPASLGGQLALIQSGMLMSEDREKAVTLLGVARLLMPGTLVEDVALRREILAMAERHDVDKFMILSEQYARRFRRSVYADNFWQSFAGAVARMTPSIDAQAQRRLDGLVGMLGVEGQRGIFLSIARTAAVFGNISLARFTADHAAALCQDGSVDKARAKLYAAAAMVVTEDFDAGVETLESIAKIALPPRDEQLRKGVLAVAHELRRVAQPVEPADAAQAAPDPKDTSPAGVQLATAAATIGAAEKRLADTDQLLKGGP